MSPKILASLFAQKSWANRELFDVLASVTSTEHAASLHTATIAAMWDKHSKAPLSRHHVICSPSSCMFTSHRVGRPTQNDAAVSSATQLRNLK
jgi:hypothetical protein